MINSISFHYLCNKALGFVGVELAVVAGKIVVVVADNLVVVDILQWLARRLVLDDLEGQCCCCIQNLVR